MDTILNMKLLSIDVGIKNLAYCLMEGSDILAWDVINLCGEEPICSEECKKKAKFAHTNKYYCQLHAKKTGLIIPTATFSLKKIKKMKLAELRQVQQDYKITISADCVKKEDILKAVIAFMEKTMLSSVNSLKANDMDLIMIGIAMRKAFDNQLQLHLSTIEQIVIENQISPIANRMKTLQGMIAQYFIMRDKTKIVFVSAANKLKGHTLVDAEGEIKEVDTSDYASRKKEGIKVTLKLLIETPSLSLWTTYFNSHKKKDDLADSFLQGVWYVNSLTA